MKYTKIIAAALSCALLLAGCSGADVEKTDTSTEPKTEATASANSAAEEKQDTIKDKLDPKTVMTIGDVEVSNQLVAYMLSAYYARLNDIDKAKDAALEDCENNLRINAVAKAMGVELDDEAKERMEDNVEGIVENNGGDLEAFLEEIGIGEDDFRQMISTSYYAEALNEKIGEKEYTEDEKKEFFKENYRRAKHILIATKDTATQADLPEDKQEEAKKKAEDLLERAKKGEDFDAMVEEFSEDPGSSTNPDGYVFTDGTMVSEFQDGVDSIEPGEFTLVKSTYGYHVIQRLALDDPKEFFDTSFEENRSSVEGAIVQKRFDDQIGEWVKEYNIETKIDDDVLDDVVKFVKEG